ncbi:MAG: hypothetical protein WAX07_05810 [Candidatus Altiarchaeia archaeon]
MDDDGDGYADGRDVDCGGCAQCSSGTCCNAANGCYLAAGQQGCGACKYCTGSGNACANVAAGSDTYNACAVSWTGCSGSCVKTGVDGNCNGAGACNTGGASENCAVNTYCSSGSCNSGACNSAWHCTVPNRCQYTCNGAGTCNTDYNCGAGNTETISNGNCADGVDNDCDGYTDAADGGCEDCECTGTGYEIKTLRGVTVYVDCNADKCWTPTMENDNYGHIIWGPQSVDMPSCIGAGDSYPACDYCDDLDYGGITDWILPSFTVLQALCNSGNCPHPHTCFDGDGEYLGGYWSSTQYDLLHAYGIVPSTCGPNVQPREHLFHVRCVRS